ncbi:MAG: nuclease family protein [Acidimicrobiaceae bacterium]|nr:nuclease family protein [Acidimicrobiaceae bacterium]
MLTPVTGRIEIVAYGDEAFTALKGVIGAAQADDRLAPVTVVAASARAAIHLRRRFASVWLGPARAGLANARFVVLSDVVEALGEEPLLAAGRRRLTRTALLAAVRATLATSAGTLAGVARHPSTAEELAQRYEELREAGPAATALLGSRPGVAREVARLVVAVRGRLEQAWFDDVDLLESARVRGSASRLPADLGTVVVYMPERLSSGESALLGELATQVPVVAHVGLVGDDVADEHASRIVAGLVSAGLVLHDARKSGLAGASASEVGQPLAAMQAVRMDRVIVAADAPGEARAAVRLVVDHLEKGSAPELCALLYTASTPYGRLVAGLLDAAGVPWSGPAPDPVGETPPARLISGLLGLIASGPRLRRGAVVAWLGSAPVVDGAGRAVPIGEWDRCSRLAGIVDAEPRAFAAHLRRHADDMIVASRRRGADGRTASSADRVDADAGVSPPVLKDSVRSRRDERTAEACSAMAELVDSLVPTIESARSSRTWSELADWSASALDRFLGPARRRGLATSPDAVADDLVLAVLRELAALDDIDPAPDLARFAEAFTAACDRLAPHSAAGARAVVVGPLESAAGLGLDLAVVVGAVEGALPRRPPPSPLLEGDDRDAAGLDPLSSRRVVEGDRRRLLVALAGARERAATVAERDSRSGRALLRSRFLAPGSTDERAPSFAAALAGVATGALSALSRSELECAVLAHRGRRLHDLADHPVARAMPALGDGLRVVASRGAHSFDRFAGRVADPAGDGGVDLGGRLLSPTSLEAYATCPFRYFLGHVLDCEVVEEPERRLSIDARDRGSIVHEILERFVGDLIAAGDISRGTDTDTGEPRAGSAERLAATAAETFAKYQRLGLTGKAVLWDVERRRILAWLETERVADELRRASGLLPVAVELAFGFRDLAPVTRHVVGRELHFRGKIDRVDRARDGSLVVIDYKTGSPKSYVGLDADSVDRGRHLQLPIYALATRAADAHLPGAHASVPGSSLAPDGRGPEDHEAPPVAPRVHAVFRFVADDPAEYRFELSEPEVAHLDDVLGVLTGAIDRGSFPMRPGERGFGGFEHCRWCDFDALCPADRDRYWSSACATPQLGAYVGLVEGEPAEAGAVTGAR